MIRAEKMTIHDPNLLVAIRVAALRTCARMPKSRPHALDRSRVLHDSHVVKGESGNVYLFQYAAVPDGTPHAWNLDQVEFGSYSWQNREDFAWNEKRIAAVMFAMEEGNGSSFVRCPVSHEKAEILWGPYKGCCQARMKYADFATREWAKNFVADYESIARRLETEAEMEEEKEKSEIRAENDARQAEKQMISILEHVQKPKFWEPRWQPPKPKQRKRKSR